MAGLTCEAQFRINKQTLNLESASGLKWMLLDNTYTFNPDDQAVSTIASAEATGTGYTGGFGGSGRKAVAGAAFTKDLANNQVTFGATGPVWSGIDVQSIHGVALIQEITNDASSLFIGYFDAVVDKDPDGGSLTVSLPGGLVFAHTV